MSGVKDSFYGYHPLVNMLYFLLVLLFSMFFLHPVCLGISCGSALSYSLYINGLPARRFTLRYLLPLMIFAALLNPAFNHQGATILTYLPSGNPLTLESIVYGLAAALMLVTVISWFSCFNTVMSSDKLVYLLGGVIPALSLVLAMALRFAPRFKAQMKVISAAQKGVGRDAASGNILQRARRGIKILSIMVTWALENAIETADSMRGRGYGLMKRTAFSLYHFDRRDGAALIFILACSAYILYGVASGGLYFRYFPTVTGVLSGAYAFSLFAAYGALCLLPMILNFAEDRKWKLIASKI
jgi:energy-coupling factor transport system permease protein